MPELPIKLYRTTDRLTVAARTPGLLPEDLTIRITADNRLVLDGRGRGNTVERQTYARFVRLGDGETAARQVIQEVWERLADEWTTGPCHREIHLPVAVNGAIATATYGNGVVVVVMPVAERVSPAELRLTPVGMGHGEHVGSASYPIQPLSDAAHRGAKLDAQAHHHGGYDPHQR